MAMISMQSVKFKEDSEKGCGHPVPDGSRFWMHALNPDREETLMKPRQLRLFTSILVLALAMAFLSFPCSGVYARAAEQNSHGRCNSISLEKAATLLNVPVEDLRQSSSDLMISPEDIQKKIYETHPYTHTIRSTSNFLKLISYAIYVYHAPGQGRTDYETMKGVLKPRPRPRRSRRSEVPLFGSRMNVFKGWWPSGEMS